MHHNRLLWPVLLFERLLSGRRSLRASHLVSFVSCTEDEAGLSSARRVLRQGSS